MRVCSLFPAFRLYPNDTTREGPRRVGIDGLRHKSRHKSVHHNYVTAVFLARSAELSGSGVPLRQGHTPPWSRVEKNCKISERPWALGREPGTKLLKRSAPERRSFYGTTF